MTDAGRHVVFHDHAGCGERSGGQFHRAERDDVVHRAVDEQNGRAATDVCFQLFRCDEHARHADDAGNRMRSTQTDMQRHHRSLTEADKQEAVAGKSCLLQFRVDEGVECWRRRCSAGRALGHGKGLDRPPLMGRCHVRDLQRSVRRHEGRLWKGGLHHRRKRNEVFAAGAIAMDQDDQGVWPRA